MSVQSGILAAMAAWDGALDGAALPRQAAEVLDRALVRDLLVACAADSTARALSGAEALGAVPAGTTARYCGSRLCAEDAEWFTATMIGDGVVSVGRVQRLRELCRGLWEDERLTAAARANAGALWSWAAWMDGHTAEARGALAAVLDADSGHVAASLLLQVIDVRRRTRG